MNGKDIFKGLNYIGSDLIEKAEMGSFPEEERQDLPAEGKALRLTGKEPKYLRSTKVRRPVFIAAMIALMVLLVGCTAVVLLRLDKLRIGEKSYVSKTRYSQDGAKILPTEKTMQYICVTGSPGSKNQLAAQEWWEFCQSYDPDGKKAQAAFADGFQRPERYQEYFTVNTPEKVDKLDDIREKYGLQLEGGRAVILEEDEPEFEKIIGQNNILKGSSGYGMQYQGTIIWECGNFVANYLMTMPLEKLGKEESFSLTYCYHDKAYITDAGGITLEDAAAAEEWNYTCSDGTNVLIVMGKDEDSYILYDRGDSFISLTVRNVGWDWDDPSEVMTHKDLENIAEAAAFSLKPQKIENFPDFQARMEQAWQAKEGATEPPEVVEARKREYEENECLDSFPALIERMRDHEDYFTSHISGGFENFWGTMNFSLRDVTGDGEEDLLLGKDGNIRSIWSMVNGKTKGIAIAEVGKLCQDNILWDYRYLDGAGYNWYFRLDQGDFMTSLLDVEYSVHDETWYKIDYTKEDTGPDNWEKISEEEMRKIVDSFQPVELSWKSVQEFPMN